jgi:hypothetical protein
VARIGSKVVGVSEKKAFGGGVYIKMGDKSGPDQFDQEFVSY